MLRLPTELIVRLGELVPAAQFAASARRLIVTFKTTKALHAVVDALTDLDEDFADQAAAWFTSLVAVRVNGSVRFRPTIHLTREEATTMLRLLERIDSGDEE